MIDAILIGLLFLGGLVVLLALLFKAGKRRKIAIAPLPDFYLKLLNEHVAFYNRLADDEKINFENRVQHFLSTTRITGIKTTVEDIDKVLIGASAIIPIYAFPDWEYINLHEVLLSRCNIGLKQKYFH